MRVRVTVCLCVCVECARYEVDGDFVIRIEEQRERFVFVVRQQQKWLYDKAAGFLLEGVLFLRREARDEHVALLMGLAEADQLLAHLADLLAVYGRLLAQLLDQLSLRR